ncbi:hypothetical protein CPB85DRAFT_1257515 [Mucidula mucida]|nr:hypothetical protein CPB85DRAFT_1257515 [Mucidula mucida]
MVLNIHKKIQVALAFIQLKTAIIKVVAIFWPLLGWTSTELKGGETFRESDANSVLWLGPKRADNLQRLSVGSAPVQVQENSLLEEIGLDTCGHIILEVVDDGIYELLTERYRVMYKVNNTTYHSTA